MTAKQINKPKKAEAPKKEQPPKEQPQAEAPKTEEPKIEEPKVEHTPKSKKAESLVPIKNRLNISGTVMQKDGSFKYPGRTVETVNWTDKDTKDFLAQFKGKILEKAKSKLQTRKQYDAKNKVDPTEIV